MSDVDQKRQTVQRKRKACGDLRQLLVEVGVDIPEDLLRGSARISEAGLSRFSRRGWGSFRHFLVLAVCSFTQVLVALSARCSIQARGRATPEQTEKLESIVAVYNGRLPEARPGAARLSGCQRAATIAFRLRIIFSTVN